LDWSEKHILKLATEQTPERFILTDLCSEKFMPTTISTRFSEVTAPILSVKNESGQAVLTWNVENFLKYDVYENDELYDKDCETPYSIPVNEGETKYYIVAKNQFSEVETKSNIVTLYVPEEETEDVEKEAQSLKKVVKHWLF